METTINIGTIEHKIYPVRGQKVMLDSDLAALYGVKTGDLNRAVKRNAARFPGDFMFQLTPEETEALRCQTGILGLREHLTSQREAIKPVHGGHRKYLPYVFTEQGVAMLSSVLRSRQAVQVNIAVMRAFKYDFQFAVVFKALREFMALPEEDKGTIGILAKENPAGYKTFASNREHPQREAIR